MADQTLTSVLWFKIKPGMNAEFEQAFADCGMLERPRVIAGYRGATLHRSITQADEYFVLGTWDSEDDYSAWKAIASDGAPPDALARLARTIDTSTTGSLLRPC